MNQVQKTDAFGLSPIEPAEGIAAAMARAQAKIKGAVKDIENPAFKAGGKVSKYADLAAVWEACRGPLSDNGLSIVQTTEFDKDDVWLVTTLLHSSGEKISGRYPLRPVKNDPQGYGSALTYARRYTIAAMVGVVADEDDDGNRASHANGNGDARNADTPIDAGKQQTIRDLLTSTKADIEKFCTYMKVASIADISNRNYERAITALNLKAKEIRNGV